MQGVWTNWRRIVLKMEMHNIVFTHVPSLRGLLKNYIDSIIEQISRHTSYTPVRHMASTTTIQQLPTITLSKRELQEGAYRLQTSGVGCLKWIGISKTVPKTLYMDRGGTALFYTPSEKPLVNRLISFKHMTCINVEVKDVMSIDNEVRRVELRIESNGPFKKPLRLSMMEKDGILVAQVAARRVGYHSEHITKNAFQRRLREVWLLGDADRSGSISLQELVELLKRLNVKVSPAEVEERFAQVDTDHSNSLEFHEFVHLFRGLTTIRCLSELFRYFASEHRHEEIEGDAAAEDEEEEQAAAAKQPPKLLFANGLVRFFREAQGEIVPEEIADGIIELYAGGRNSTKKNEEYDGLEETNPSVRATNLGMTLHAFSLLMVDTVRNSWFDGDHDRVFQSMDEPLHHYRIACSHNTYSSGSQFSSQSKTEMYHRVLRQQGCRCVEIDCHNGARLPMVYHHYTPTSEISFEDVVDAIKESAFVSSPFPVVLSLEVHTDARQTMIIAHTLMSKLGTALLYPEELQSYGGPLPFTPNALQYRILVKWKGSPDDIIAQQQQHPTPPSSQQHFDPNDQTAHAARTQLGFRSCRAKLDGNSLLRSLITVGGVHTKDGVNCKLSDIQSTSEGDMIKMVGKSFQLKNTRMMTRGYPAGSRMMDSTNLDPMVPWSNGVQMVAMNYQTWDEPMHLHEGMFRVNGRCGYLLKPLSLRTAERVEDMWLGTTMPKSMVLTVRVLFGYQLSHLKADVDTLNTLVEVSVRECPQTLNAAASPFTSPNAMHEDSSFGASLRSPSTVTSVGSGSGNDHASAFEPAGTFEALRSPASRSSTTPITFSQHKAPKSLSLNKTRVITKKTSVVRKEGFLPYWDEVFTFPILDVELAMLSIHVKDKELTTDKSVGYGCVPLSSLMLGYRAVSLLSPQGEPLYGSAVVCHFSLSV